MQIIGVAVTASAGGYFRVAAGELNGTSVLGNVLLCMVMVLPAVGTSLVILDATVFRLRDQEEKHKKAVRLWGGWIRRASEAGEEGGALREDAARKIEKRYRKCMMETSNTSVSSAKFVEYKSDWIRKKNESIKLDLQKKYKKTREPEDDHNGFKDSTQ